jgi:hypothetical protein
MRSEPCEHSMFWQIIWAALHPAGLQCIACQRDDASSAVAGNTSQPFCITTAPQQPVAHINQQPSPCCDTKLCCIGQRVPIQAPCPSLCFCARSYAHKVAAGYRPSRPKSKHMTDTIWALISACWQQDPLLRPHMSEVRQHDTRLCCNATALQPMPCYGVLAAQEVCLTVLCTV